MSQGDRTWVGVDPGGKKKFGVAILHPDGSAYTCCVSCVDEALDVVCQQVKDSPPAGVGVDAPLWWSSGISSDRCADQRIRRIDSVSSRRVLAPSSLRGSVLVQGVMFVQLMRQSFPTVPVTETHPKALLDALGIRDGDNFRRHFSIQADATGESEHERDAMISAVAAREGFEKRWTNDLSVYRHPSEQDPSEYWLAPIHYFWPDSK